MGKLTPEQVVNTLNNHAEHIRGFGVTRIGLFGSYLKGCAGEESDLDFLVSFEDPTFDKYMELKFFLEELFGKKVDLVIEENLRPAFADVKKAARYAEAI